MLRSSRVNKICRVVRHAMLKQMAHWARRDKLSPATSYESVRRARAQHLWIRFYTFDGLLNGDGDGLTPSYDFGSDVE
jgi:hypothetical protein